MRMVYHHRLLEELDRIARERGLSVVDNIALTDANPGSLTTWVHLTADANRRLAEALGEAIVELRTRARAGHRSVAAGELRHEVIAESKREGHER